MDLDFTGLPGAIASSTTGYLGSFAPLFTFVLGLTLAIAVITALVGVIHRGGSQQAIEDDTMDEPDFI